MILPKIQASRRSGEASHGKIQASHGKIQASLEGAAGKTVRLYTIGGALMTTVTPQAGKTGKFSVATGTYIVQIGSKAAKVVVK